MFPVRSHHSMSPVSATSSQVINLPSLDWRDLGSEQRDWKVVKTVRMETRFENRSGHLGDTF